MAKAEPSAKESTANSNESDEDVFCIGEREDELLLGRNSKRLDLESDITIIRGANKTKVSSSANVSKPSFTPKALTKKTSDERDSEESVFDTQNVLSSENEGGLAEGMRDEAELLVRDSVGEVREKRKSSLRKRSKVIRVFFSLLGVGVIGLLLTLLFFHHKQTTEAELSETLIEKKISDKNYKIYNKIFDASSAKKVLNRFLDAQTVGEALKYTLPDKTITQSMRKYWQPTEYSRVKAINALPIRKHEGQIYFFECTNDELKVKHIYPVIGSKWQKTPLVDWRFPSQIQDMPISEALKTKKKGIVQVRCGVTVEDYYNYDFRDKDRWQSFSCWDTIHYTDSAKNRLDSYVERDSEVHKELLKQIYKQSGFIPKQESLEYTNTSIEMLHSQPVGLEKIRFTNKLLPYKGNANLILELNIVDPQHRVAVITKVISAEVVDYFEAYQLPYLVKRK